MRNMITAAIAALSFAHLTVGHTWIHQLRSINDDGKYVGEFGYPRGMMVEGDEGYNGPGGADTGIQNLLPGPQGGLFINDSTPVCHPNQRKQEQRSPDKYPRLQAAAGKFVALRYRENGHVTLNGTPGDSTNKFKPDMAGTTFIYGTTDPIENEVMGNVLRWTKDGQGGDKRGVLLATNNFNDGRCYQINNSPESIKRLAATPNFALGQTSGQFELPCESNVQIPTNATSGKPYTLYWVWQWNNAPGKPAAMTQGKDEYYTTCMDIDVVDAVKQDTSAKFALLQQDGMTEAVSDFKSRTALVTDPADGEVGPMFKKGQSPTGGAPSASGAPPAPQTTLATSVMPPAGGSSPAPTGIPILTNRPGRPQPSNKPGDSNGNGNVVTVTDTVFVTVTAPAVTQAATPRARAEHVARHLNGAKFRGRLT